MNYKNRKPFPHMPKNVKLYDEYQELIDSDIEKFIQMLDSAQIDINSLSERQRHIIKKYRSGKSKSSVKDTMKALWDYLMVYKASVIAVFIVTLISVSFNSIISYAMVYLTNALQATKTGATTANPNPLATFSIIAGIILIFYFVYAFGLWFQTRIMAIISQKNRL